MIDKEALRKNYMETFGLSEDEVLEPTVFDGNVLWKWIDKVVDEIDTVYKRKLAEVKEEAKEQIRGEIKEKIENMSVLLEQGDDAVSLFKKLNKAHGKLLSDVATIEVKEKSDVRRQIEVGLVYFTKEECGSSGEAEKLARKNLADNVRVRCPFTGEEKPEDFDIPAMTRIYGKDVVEQWYLDCFSNGKAATHWIVLYVENDRRPKNSRK